MNRTTVPCVVAALFLAASSRAQGTPSEPPQQAQDPAIKELVETLRKAEAGARSVAIELRTRGAFPGGLTFETQGTLRVLRGEHPRMVARMEFSFQDGLSGRMETLKTPEGVWILEQNPTFGEVYLVMDKELITDLQWAAAVLGRSDSVPGVDSRAESPLGSELLQETARQFDLRVMSRGERNGQPGRWIGGDLRTGQKPEVDPEIPIADRVELFVRDGDSALLEIVHLQDGKPVQRIEIVKLEVNRPMDPAGFQLQVGDLKAKPVREHLPAWAQIERVLAQADEQADPTNPRPSRKDKAPAETGR